MNTCVKIVWVSCGKPAIVGVGVNARCEKCASEDIDHLQYALQQAESRVEEVKEQIRKRTESDDSKP